MNARGIIRRSILVLLFGFAVWFFATRYRPIWGWPLGLAFGVAWVLVMVYVHRKMNKPAPFQLVLQMANDQGGDQADGRTFDLLWGRFKRLSPSPGGVRFDGFDTDGNQIWFYFHGPDAGVVREAVLPQLRDCQVRKGSYFLSGATQSCAPPNAGAAISLGDLGGMERLSSGS